MLCDRRCARGVDNNVRLAFNIPGSVYGAEGALFGALRGAHGAEPDGALIGVLWSVRGADGALVRVSLPTVGRPNSVKYILMTRPTGGCLDVAPSDYVGFLAWVAGLVRSGVTLRTCGVYMQ